MRWTLFTITLLCFGITNAEIRTTSRTTVESGFSYDDNIVFPDSITLQPSAKENIAIANKWFFQFDRMKMLRLGLNFWTEKIDAFPQENIQSYGTNLQYRTFPSPRMMLNTTLSYDRQFSPSEFYEADILAGNGLAGYHWGPHLYTHVKYEATLKRLLAYKRYNASPSDFTPYFPNNYLRHQATAYLRQALGNRWSLYVENRLHHKDYYDDDFDVEYLGAIGTMAELDSALDATGYDRFASLDSIDLASVYVDLGTGDTVYDSTYFYGLRNTHQTDLLENLKMGLKFNANNRLVLDVAVAGEILRSKDQYYDYNGAELHAIGQYRNPFCYVKLYYSLAAKSFLNRYVGSTLQALQRDVSHLLRLGLARDITKDLNLEFKYAYRILTSNYPDDENDENVFTASLIYRR